jgi:nitrogen fixation NifU-like protein
MIDPLAKVMDHFHNPRNVGEVADPDGTGRVSPGYDGDDLAVTFKRESIRCNARAKGAGTCDPQLPTAAVIRPCDGTTGNSGDNVVK